MVSENLSVSTDSPAFTPSDPRVSAEQRATVDQSAPVERTKKRRRVATFVSDVDRKLIAHGVAPSWEDRVHPDDRRAGSFADSPDRGDGANDRRLLDNVPPHAQVRA